MSDKPKRGRPSKYTPEIAAEICERLAAREPLTSIVQDAHMPGYQTVADWQKAYPEFAVEIARAREHGYDAIAAECLPIADGEGDPQRDKLRVWARLELLKRWDPKRYGERTQQDVQLSGAAGGPLEIFVNGVKPKGE